MGNTIRRQPITFNIPDEPDYQFLNVLDFRGLKLTDNPFTADSNTASDALNVYVDEANALATRPRLELFLSKFSDMTSVYNIYNIKDGFLVHYLKESVPSIDIILNEGFVRKSVTGTIPTGTKLSIFEQNDIIYMLDGKKYYNIINYVSSEVEGHIPTTRVGMTNKTEGSSYENLNILTDKYKETYFWDGTWDIEDIITTEDVITNNYINQSDIVIGGGVTILKYLPNSSKDVKDFLAKNDSNVIGLYRLDDSPHFISLTMPTNLPEYYSDITADASDDYNNIAVLYLADNTGDTSKVTGGLYVNKLNPKTNSRKWYEVVLSAGDYFTSKTFAVSTRFSLVKISNDGNIVIAMSANKIYVCEYNSSTDSYDVQSEEFKTLTTDSTKQPAGFVTNRYCSQVALVVDNFTDVNPSPSVSDYEYNNTTLWFYNVSNQTLSHKEYITNNYLYGTCITNDNRWLITIDSEVRLYSDTTTDKYIIMKDFMDKNKVSISNTRFYASEDSDKIYYVNTQFSIFTGWISLDNNVCVRVPGLRVDYGEPEAGFQQAYANSTSFYHMSDTDLRFSEFLFDSQEPLLEILKDVSLDSDNYADWNERRNKFFKSFLTTRFNNERWFASGSRLYYTSNNDPSYIGLFNYNDLGESDEDITGFNLAEDTLLIVYKDTRVHSVQYTTVGDAVYTYVYSDSQNVVGNNAIGASIVTALTEVPIQISYDGIYALAQLKNVQSSTRISQSISEDIDKKWLKENKNSIKHALTMNRLYWTYVILDEVDSAGDPIFSKVYLLDNRHNSWFYWEFPIRIINAFSKNNTTHFIGSDGNIYVLKTTDIINEYNPDLLEYYDLDKQLIKWKWKSQILPMKTINYSKKLITTTFILSDTDENDEYGLQYKFKAFRKMASETQETTLTNRINYVVSTTKRTLIPRYNFMQLELLNIEDDLNNNKLRLIGLGFKYVLLEGML